MNSFKNSFSIFPSEDYDSLKKTSSDDLILDGYRLPDMIGLHKLLKTGLNLPSYSRPNLDSLDEILNDPDWLESKENIHLRIFNYPQLLHFEPEDKKRSLLSILDSMCQILGYNAVSIQNCPEIEKDLDRLNLPYHISPLKK